MNPIHPIHPIERLAQSSFSSSLLFEFAFFILVLSIQKVYSVVISVLKLIYNIEIVKNMLISTMDEKQTITFLNKDQIF
jgi:hypothetical protein